MNSWDKDDGDKGFSIIIGSILSIVFGFSVTAGVLVILMYLFL